MSIVIILRILQAKEVSWDTIAGAVCGYLLIAIAFSSLFDLIQDVYHHQGAFNFPDGATIAKSSAEQSSLLLYFSFVTLTTLGYGDISPVIGIARSAAVLEAVVGQMYVAILIARLVGITISQSRSET